MRLQTYLFLLLRWEGFSNVIAEALGYGLSVVSTNCKSGPSEILKNGKYGLLVPIENPKKLALAISNNLKKKYDKKLLIKRSEDFALVNFKKIFKIN